MKSVTLLLILSISTACIASPLIHRELNDIPKATDPMYRLNPEGIDITRYDIKLTPYFRGSNAFTFDGEVTISAITTANNVNSIKLHAKQLRIESVTVTRGNGATLQPAINPIDEVYDFWTINFGVTLGVIEEIKINISYIGILDKDMAGFYRSYYDENQPTGDGQQKNLIRKWMGTTQFQEIDARRAFPCYDEPAYKAVFKVTIRRPADFSPSLSNTKLESSIPDGEFIEDTFLDTPKMSTYLLAFVVSEYEAANKTSEPEVDQYGIWARPEASDQGNYAFVTAKKIVDTIGEYLNYPFRNMSSNLKNDHVSIPDFSAGAMENWGLVTYRESYLMYDPNETSVRYQQQIASILSHEIAHFWFGDLVTCRWWSQTWLNEGFASYFQSFATDWMEDEDKTMDMITQFNTARMHSAFSVDAANTSYPMTNPETNSPAEVSRMFGTETYQKGGSVIKMTRDLLGETTFRKGLTNYIAAKQFDSVDEIDLFNQLQAAADADLSIVQYNNTNVVNFMRSWTNFNGFPYLDVNVQRNGDNSIVQIQQRRFLRLNHTYEDEDRLWHVPITYTTKSENAFNNTKPKFVLTTRQTELTDRIKADDWIIFNVQQSGYYRVKYDDESLKLITDALRENNNIDTQNKAQIVDDLFNFAREGVINYTQLLQSTIFLNDTTEYAPWTAALAGYSYLNLRFYHIFDARDELAHHFMLLMGKVIQELGFEEKPNETHLTKLFRINIFNLACPLGLYIDYNECQNKSVEMFDNYKLGVPVPPNMREYVYCNAMRHGHDEFEFLWNKYLTENVANEKIVILNALGCSRHYLELELLLYRTLFEDSPIRDQDKMTAFNAVLTGNRVNIFVAYEFVKDNVRAIKQTFGDGGFRGMLDNIASRCWRTLLEDMERFLETNPYLTADDITSVRRSIRNSHLALDWSEQHADEIIDYLQELYGQEHVGYVVDDDVYDYRI